MVKLLGYIIKKSVIMNYKLRILGVATFFFCMIGNTYGQDSWTAKQKEVLETMNKLSESTTIDGNGADAYGSLLSDDFSRWIIGSDITNNKKKWVEGVREWFDDGWRVSDRAQDNLEILILKDVAHTRRIVTETYLGPNGDSSVSKAALAEIWLYKEGRWLLYRVNVHPMDNM